MGHKYSVITNKNPHFFLSLWEPPFLDGIRRCQDFRNQTCIGGWVFPRAVLLTLLCHPVPLLTCTWGLIELAQNFPVSPLMTSIFALFRFLVSEGGNAKGPSRRVSCQRPVALQTGSERAGKGGAGGGKCPSYEADSSLLGLFCLLRLVQCPEQKSGSRARTVGTSRNILIHFWLLCTLSVATPMEGASGWSFRGCREGQPGPWPPAAWPCCEGHQQMERERHGIVQADLLKYGSAGQWVPLWFSPWTVQ